MMQPPRSFGVIVPSLLILVLSGLPARAAPEGQMSWAVHVTLAPFEDLRLKK